jgi:hypothetical protein
MDIGRKKQELEIHEKITANNSVLPNLMFDLADKIAKHYRSQKKPNPRGSGFL